MTRCGDRRCTVPSHRNQAHPIPPLPSNVRRHPRDLVTGDPIAYDGKSPVYFTITDREIVRTDPGYDQPGPPRRSDLSWAMVVQAFVVFVAVVMFCVLASLVEVGS